MVVPLVKLIDDGESELQQFEAAMTLCNLATVPELRERIVKAKAWRALEMALTSDNELVQRASVECLSNLVQEEEIAEKFQVLRNGTYEAIGLAEDPFSSIDTIFKTHDEQ